MNTAFEEWKKDLEADKRYAKHDSAQLFVIGGGSFVGKSTSAKALLNNGILASGPVLLDAPLIRRFYDSKQGSIFDRHPEKSEENYPHYVKARDAAVLHCLEQGYSVVLDEHCDDVANIKPLMDKVHALDNVEQTTLIGQCLELDTYKHRIRRRFAEEQLFGIKTSQQFFNNIEQLLPLFDQSVILEGEAKENRAIVPLLSGSSEDGIFTYSSFDQDAYQRAATILKIPQMGASDAPPVQSPLNVPTSKVNVPEATHYGTLCEKICAALNAGKY